MMGLIDDALDRAGAALSVARAARLRGGVNERLLKHVRTVSKVEPMPAKQRAAVGATDLGQLGAEEGVNAFLASIRSRSLLDTLRNYAYLLPPGIRSVQLATGVAADEVLAGAAKPVTRAAISNERLDKYTVAGILVATNQLLAYGGPEAERLIERELERAVIKASNAAVIAAISTSGVNGTGDVLGDLVAGLAAAADSDGYVVAVSRADARALSVKTDGRLGVHGGRFADGVEIVAVDDIDDMLVFPASAFALRDHGLSINRSRAANIAMADDPAGDSTAPTPAETVNMFQTNSTAFLAEREFEFYAGADVIEVQSDDS